MKVAFIIHGNRKLSENSEAIIRTLQEKSSFNVVLHKTEGVGHARELAVKLSENNDCLIAVGGDGTCNEVVNGIVESGKDPLFGIIANGTGNDFIRMFEPYSGEELIKYLNQGTFKKLDLGKISGVSETKYFLNIADLGFGAEVVSILERSRTKNPNGKLLYPKAILRAFFSYKKPEITLTVHGEKIKGKMLMAVFANGTVFGDGVIIAPEASPFDSQLNLTLIGDVNLFTYVRYLKKLRAGHKIDHPQVRYLKFQEIEIEVNEGKPFMEADGEFVRFFATKGGNNARKIRFLDPKN